MYWHRTCHFRQFPSVHQHTLYNPKIASGDQMKRNLPFQNGAFKAALRLPQLLYMVCVCLFETETVIWHVFGNANVPSSCCVDCAYFGVYFILLLSVPFSSWFLSHVQRKTLCWSPLLARTGSRRMNCLTKADGIQLQGCEDHILDIVSQSLWLLFPSGNILPSSKPAISIAKGKNAWNGELFTAILKA